MVSIKWHLGDVVRTLRDREGWTQEDLAAKAAVNKATVVSVEKLDRNHGRSTYEKIARAFGLSLSEIYALIPDQETQRETIDKSSSSAGGGFPEGGSGGRGRS